ncbi:MAG: PKD domain-containing protein, partial [Candidatus Bipolaricaulaceae bacterium]
TLANQPPQGVDFDWSPKAPKWSDTITFTPSAAIRDPDGDIRAATFRWAFGDGRALETRGPEAVRHLYEKGGEFTVTLTVVDAGGAEATKSYKITVSNQPPTGVDFTVAPEAPKWGEPVTFIPVRGVSDPDGDIGKAVFAWDFGDGNKTQTTGPQEVRHTYAKGGEYEVTLTVTDQGGASEKKAKKITVGWPAVSFTWRPEQPKTEETVTFTASPAPDTYGFRYRWDFGDGTVYPPAGQPPAATNVATHTYTLPETVMEKEFTVKLTVALGETLVGTAENKIKIVRIINKPPTVTALRMEPAMPKPGEEITFTATASDPDGDAIVEWQWDLGDGTTRSTTTGTTKHKYERAGAYTVKVRAKDAGSGTFSDWRSLSFYVGTQPIGVNVLDNPASTTCRIQIFTPAGATKVRITILDAAGRTVLPEKDVAGGTFTWDLKDREGRAVPNGLYLFFVTAEFQGQTIRSEVGRILVRR